MSRNFFRAAAKKIAPMWFADRALDYTIMPAENSAQGTLKKLANLGVDRVWTAAASDTMLTETIVRQIQHLDPLTELWKPDMVRRVIVGNRRTAARAAETSRGVASSG